MPASSLAQPRTLTISSEFAQAMATASGGAPNGGSLASTELDAVGRRRRPLTEGTRETILLVSDLTGDKPHVCLVSQTLAEPLQCKREAARQRLWTLENAGLATSERCVCTGFVGTHLRVILTPKGRELLAAYKAGEPIPVSKVAAPAAKIPPPVAAAAPRPAAPAAAPTPPAAKPAAIAAPASAASPAVVAEKAKAAAPAPVTNPNAITQLLPAANGTFALFRLNGQVFRDPVIAWGLLGDGTSGPLVLEKGILAPAQLIAGYVGVRFAGWRHLDGETTGDTGTDTIEA